jgi:HEAT repeat protein
MNCESLLELLDHGDTGALSESDRRAIEAHVDTCADCAAAWEVHAGFQTMPTPPVPAGLEERCWAGFAGAPEVRKTRHVGPVILGCLVAGAAAAIGGSLWLSSDRDPAGAGGVESLLAPAQSATELRAADSAGTGGPASASPTDAGDAGVDGPIAGSPALGGTFTVEFTRLVPVDASALEMQFSNSFHAAMVGELRRVPNLVLIEGAEHREVKFDERFGIPRPGEAPEQIFDPDPASWPDGVDFRLAAGVGLQGNWIRLRHSIRSADGGGGGSGKGEALPAGFTAGPEHAAAYAAEVVEELRVEEFPADASGMAVQFEAFDAVIQDPSAGFEERMEALSSAAQIVRRARNPAITSRFVDSALLLATQVESAASASSEFLAMLARLLPDEQAAMRSQVGTLRASVFRYLGDTDDTRLIRPMSDALLYDPHEEVRLAAARILGEFADDAVARSALESAAQSDASAEVRETARQYVIDDAARLDDIFTVVRDSSLPDAERLAPIMYWDQLQFVERGFLLDTTTVTVIAELVARNADVGTRRQVLVMLGMTESPSLVPIFIDRLRNDPSPEVRVHMPGILSPHRELPDVDVALAIAASDDPAENVRAAAARILERETP